MILSLLLAFSASANTMSISLVDGDEIELDCGEGGVVHKAPVMMNPSPNQCAVTIWKSVAVLPQTGKVTCSTSGCDLTGDAEMLEIQAPAPISQLALDCDGSVLVYQVTNNQVNIEAPGSCSASVGASVGSVTSGVWACGLAGCTSGSHTRGITLKLAAGSPTEASLSCGDNVMRKAALSGDSFSFADVPHENCTLTFTGGGPPAKVRPIAWGDHTCEVSGSTAVCRK